MLSLIALALLTSHPVSFTLVNGTPATLERLSVRSADGKGPWRTLGPGQLSAGARGSVAAMGGEDCAFDVRGESGGATITWPAVNLCDVKVVTLNRRPDGTLWVDYE